MQIVNKVINQIKVKMPDILICLGVGGVVTGTVMACVATKKVDPIIEEHKEKIDQIHMAETVEKDTVNGTMIEYTPEVARKDIFKQYAVTTVKIAKVYTPSSLVIIGSLGCIIGSHKILNGRNAALTAAYATIESCYKDYRSQIIEKYGPDADKEIRLDIKPNKQKDGEEKTYKENKERIYKKGYSRCFDETNLLWYKDAFYNKRFLENQEQWANDRLRAMGTVSLNEVYESLGFERTQEGQIVGWIYDPKISHKISFGMSDISNPMKKEFIDGTEKAVWLDFNVDGVILNAIPLKK